MDCNCDPLGFGAKIARFFDHNDAGQLVQQEIACPRTPCHRCWRRRRRRRQQQRQQHQQQRMCQLKTSCPDEVEMEDALCSQTESALVVLQPLFNYSQSSGCQRKHRHLSQCNRLQAPANKERKRQKQRPRPHKILSFSSIFGPSRSLLLPAILLLLLLHLQALLIVSSPLAESSEFPTSIASRTKNSGQFTVSQLCAGKPQFPITKRVEGAVLTSKDDLDVNCTISFRARSEKQIFIFRFEELKLGCDEHLKMFDGDLDYGLAVIKDFSCKDNLANTREMKTTGTFLTMRFSSDSHTKSDDGFRLVITAVFDPRHWECPADYSLCANKLCISRALFCDGINHCFDNSDESGCINQNSLGGGGGGAGLLGGGGGGGSSLLFSSELTLTNALGLLVVLVLIIFTCVIIFISAIYCRRESHYAQYQHHLQRAIGVPLQTSSSLMFTNSQPQYHYFQPANLSPYLTPAHNAAIVSATLPRGYSTLPLNLAAGRQQQQQQFSQQQQLQLQQQFQQQQQQFQQQQFQQLQQRSPSIGPTKAANNIGANQEYLMMAGLSGPPGSIGQPASVQTNLFLPTSQSILAGANQIRYQQPLQQQPQPLQPPQQQQQQLQQQPQQQQQAPQDPRR